MRVWITTVGSSPFAVINTMWAACELEDYVPEKVYFVYNDKTAQNLKINKKWILRLTGEYGKASSIIDLKCVEEDFQSYSRLIHSLIFNEKKDGNTVAIDITPGRKIMSAFCMFHGLSEGGADRVYYMHLDDVKKYEGKSFIEIPAGEHKLINMKEIVG